MSSIRVVVPGRRERRTTSAEEGLPDSPEFNRREAVREALWGLGPRCLRVRAHYVLVTSVVRPQRTGDNKERKTRD